MHKYINGFIQFMRNKYSIISFETCLANIIKLTKTETHIIVSKKKNPIKMMLEN